MTNKAAQAARDVFAQVRENDQAVAGPWPEPSDQTKSALTSLSSKYGALADNLGEDIREIERIMPDEGDDKTKKRLKTLVKTLKEARRQVIQVSYDARKIYDMMY